MVQPCVAYFGSFLKLPLDRRAEVAYATDTAIPLPVVSIGCWKFDAQANKPVSNHAAVLEWIVARPLRSYGHLFFHAMR
jgi:hypothetical protein